MTKLKDWDPWGKNISIVKWDQWTCLVCGIGYAGDIEGHENCTNCGALRVKIDYVSRESKYQYLISAKKGVCYYPVVASESKEALMRGYEDFKERHKGDPHWDFDDYKVEEVEVWKEE